jgi:N-acetylmuramoyl-L-alanine amidase
MQHQSFNKTIFSVILLLLVCLYSCKKNKEAHGITKANKSLVIVVDAAHGGSDTGTISEAGYLEKDLMIVLCNKLASLAKEYNITAVPTRTADKNTTKEERVAIADATEAAIFLSFHINRNVPGKPVASGYEIIVAGNTPFYTKSKALASQIIAGFHVAQTQTIYTEKNVIILATNARPAIAIECGFQDNAEDLATILDDQKLEVMCRGVLSSIVAYSNAH